MLYTLFSTIIQLTGITYFVNLFGDTYFPDKTNRIRSYLMWQGFKMVALIEIQAKKYFIKGKALLDNYFQVQDATEEDVQFIHNGMVVKSYKSCDFSFSQDLFLKNEVFPKYDFILLYVKMPSVNKYNYNVIRIPDVNSFIYSYTSNSEEYIPSPIKFLGMKIKIKNNDTDTNTNTNGVDINFGKSNFIMNGNVLFDRPFVTFYLNKFHGIALNEHEEYEITFIGPDMDVVSITDAHYIELAENKYQIRFVRT